MPKPIRETQVLKLVSITRLSLKFWALWFTCTLQYSVECNVYLVYLYKLDRSTITPELTVIIQRKIYCSNFKNEEGGGVGNGRR